MAMSSRWTSLGSVPSHVLTVVFFLLVSSWACVSCHRSRGCKNTDIQVMTNTGARIEPYETSRIELELGEPKNRKNKKLRLSFEFRTTSANGTLFYGRTDKYPNEVIALLLRNGRPVYKIQCPSLHADVHLPAVKFEPLNDNKWHTVYYTVRFGRDGNRSVIQIDGHSHTTRYDVNCEHFTAIVMGGHSPDDVGTRFQSDVEATQGHFEGCIRQVGVSYPLSALPKYYVVSQCE
ncbi:hypothetical protein RRG08_051431 [Elysia crispata]|uniref:Laminin G domain-containing protein n=1 Tax=Elysia crispata TaxID=231223 RepID=A0AAE1E9U1_9GAST|nr:hypothetical protein RRG08_051431 [Elysia crispata]